MPEPERVDVSATFAVELRDYAEQHLPNEVIALLAGWRGSAGWAVTGFLHLQVLHADPRSAHIADAHLRLRLRTWAPLGLVHTHPGPLVAAAPSAPDRVMMSWWAQSFPALKEPLFLIYAPATRELAAYRHDGSAVPCIVQPELPLYGAASGMDPAAEIHYTIDGVAYRLSLAASPTPHAVKARLYAALARAGFIYGGDDALLARKLDLALRMRSIGAAADLGVLPVKDARISQCAAAAPRRGGTHPVAQGR